MKLAASASARALCAALALATIGCRARSSQPAPTASKIVTTNEKASAPAAPSPRRFEVVERFADVEVLRRDSSEFAALTVREKTLAYYLQQAALSGRDIAYDQGGPSNLLVRKSLEAVLRRYRGSRNTAAFDELKRLAKRVFAAQGLWKHADGERIYSTVLTREKLAELIHGVDPETLPLGETDSVETLIEELSNLLLPQAAAPSGANDRAIRPRRDNFYVGLSDAEIDVLLAARAESSVPAATGFGTNSQLAKVGQGIEERIYRVGGKYGEALSQVTAWLLRATEVTDSDAQKRALLHLSEYFTTGDPNAHDRYVNALLVDETARVELIAGFLDRSVDPKHVRGRYWAAVALADDEEKALASLIDYARSKERPEQKTAPPSDAAPLALARWTHLFVAAGSAASNPLTSLLLPGPDRTGANIPNRLWLFTDAAAVALDRSPSPELLEALCRGRREHERARKHGRTAGRLQAELEAAFTLAAPRKPRASASLGTLVGTLEQSRAQALSLVALFDPELIELGVVSSFEVARAAYDAFVRYGFYLDRARFDGETLPADAHAAARLVIVSYLLGRSDMERLVETTTGEQGTSFSVVDYAHLRDAFAAFAVEVERILEQGDAQSARALVGASGARLSEPLKSELSERIERAGDAHTTVFLEPQLRLVERDGHVEDVELTYAEDYLAQELDYGTRYALLPAREPGAKPHER